jgi:hypothetical protein
MLTMRLALAFGCPVFVCSALVACDGDRDTAPDASSPDARATTTTIQITSGQPAALVTFRDGVDGPWQAATRKTPTLFEAEVHGPYITSVVCQNTFTADGQSTESWDTWQAGRTLDDPHVYTACDAPASEHAITGTMVQPGTVRLGDSFDSSPSDTWMFHVAAASGTHDLLATTADGFAVRRAVSITADLVLTPPIDVVQEGTVLATVPFRVANPLPDETSRAVAFLETSASEPPATLYAGPIDAVKVAPDAALQGFDRQSVSLRAQRGTSTRALRRAFHSGADTMYTLPPAFGDPQWTIGGARAEVSWTLLPAVGTLSESVSGSGPGGTTAASYQLDLTDAFVAATAPTRAVIDTDIPGYLPAWRIDLTASYARQLFVQQIVDGDVISSSIDEQIDPGTAARAPARRRAGEHRSGGLARP